MEKNNRKDFSYLMIHYYMKTLKDLLNGQNLSDNLKNEIHLFLQNLEQEDLAMEEMKQIYEKVMIAYQREQSAAMSFPNNKLISLHVYETYLELSKRFQNATLSAFKNGDIVKEQAIFQTHEKVISYLSKISFLPNARNLLNLIGEIHYLSEIKDAKILDAVQSNQSLGSQVYLKKTDSNWDNCEFSVLVNEDGMDYMVSFQEDGSIYLKDPVQLVACYPWEPTKREIESKINHKFYFSLSELEQFDWGKEYIFQALQQSPLGTGINSIANMEEKMKHLLMLNSEKMRTKK